MAEPQLSAWKALLRAHAVAVGQIEERLAASKQITLSEYDVLLELKTAEQGSLRMHELARRVVLSRSGLTRLADRLEKQGFLQRVPDPVDRRGLLLELTSSGRDALAAAWPVYADGINAAFAQHLGEDDARHVARALQRVSDASLEPTLK